MVDPGNSANRAEEIIEQPRFYISFGSVINPVWGLKYVERNRRQNIWLRTLVDCLCLDPESWASCTFCEEMLHALWIHEAYLWNPPLCVVRSKHSCVHEVCLEDFLKSSLPHPSTFLVAVDFTQIISRPQSLAEWKLLFYVLCALRLYWNLRVQTILPLYT